MTNPTLERAARALECAHIECAKASGNPIEGGEDYVAMVRAVLMAVREPDDAMVEAGKEDAPYVDREDVGDIFTTMIDAILADGGE